MAPAWALTDAHAIVMWPSVYVHLISTGSPAVVDLPDILQNGSAWFTNLQTANPLITPSSDLSLTIQQTQIYADAYFHTFNVLHPILDQEVYTNDVATHVLREGYADGDIKSVIALLVYSLGQLAIEGTLDEPLKIFESGRSGIRGGTMKDPPGLAIFNEARKRMGLLSGQFSVEDVQMRLLAAAYYEAAGLHLEFWRSTLAASTSCQLLVRSTNPDWHSPAGEILKRLYWVCYLNEMMCGFDLGLPSSELSRLQGSVPLPTVSDRQAFGGSSKYVFDDHVPPQQYFPSILSLEKLIQEIHRSIIEPTTQQAKLGGEGFGPSTSTLREMAQKLDSWRNLLPRPIHWVDSEMFDFPSTEIGGPRPTEPLFAFDQGSVAVRHRYNLDITTAHLRSRFYYARHLLYQPFLFKMLHFPEALDKEDVAYATLALKSGTVWPILMAPPKDKKRLIPYAFSWTQACMSMLLIFEMSRVHDRLRITCEEHIDPQLLSRSVKLMLDWLRDMRMVDPVAEWSWRLLQPLFHAGD